MHLPRYLVLLACLWLTLAIPLGIAQAIRPSEVTGVRLVQAFLNSVYPELTTAEAHVAIHVQQPLDRPWGQGRTMRFTVWDHAPGWYLRVQNPFNERYPNGPESQRLMEGRMQLDAKGKLSGFGAERSAVIHWGQNSDLRRTVESHSEWREQQAIQALRDAGARYGPDQETEFLKTVPLRPLEPFFAKLTIRNVKFETLEPASGSLPTTAFFQWHLLVEERGVEDEPTLYIMHFEPFGGKLTDLRRRGTDSALR